MVDGSERIVEEAREPWKREPGRWTREGGVHVVDRPPPPRWVKQRKRWWMVPLHPLVAFAVRSEGFPTLTTMLTLMSKIWGATPSAFSIFPSFSFRIPFAFASVWPAIATTTRTLPATTGPFPSHFSPGTLRARSCPFPTLILIVAHQFSFFANRYKRITKKSAKEKHLGWRSY